MVSPKIRECVCKALFSGVTAVLLAAGMAYRCPAQTVAVADVSGIVADQSGSAVPGATIRMVQTDKEFVRTAVTDSEGRYVVPNLPVGPYRLEVKAAGFKDYSQSGIVLQVGRNVRQNVSLQVGAPAETVEVVAAVGMVETTQNGVGQVIDDRRINELPLNGRAFRAPFRRYSNTFPWNRFDPDLVTTLTVAPGCVPKRADSALVSTLNSCSASGNGNGRLTLVIVSVLSPPSRR